MLSLGYARAYPQAKDAGRARERPPPLFGVRGLSRASGSQAVKAGADPWLLPGLRCQSTPVHEKVPLELLRLGGLLGAAPWVWLYQPLLRQGHAWGVMQEDKLLRWLQGIGGF